MNKTLNALSTKLKWTLHGLGNKMFSIEQQDAILEQKIDSTLQKISSSCTMSALIIPEQEIARSLFMTQQHQYYDELMNKKADLQSNKLTLKNQQTRLNMELKMLEKYQKTILKNEQHHARQTSQNNSDEWVLQRITQLMINGEQQ